MIERRRVAFYTLGCKLNQYETDALAGSFRRRGFSVVDFGDPADAYVINTCTVTNKADRKSRNIINRAKKVGGRPLVVVTGCFTENHRGRLEEEAGIKLVGNDEKSRIDEIVDAYLRGEISDFGMPTGDSPTQSDPGSATAPVAGRFAYETPERIFHTRGMLKIQDGCDNFCTFCIIPHVRGRATGRPSGEVVEDARRSIDAGYRELVFTGVNMSRYRDGDVGFSRLVEKVLNLDGDFRIRISSLEPDQLDERFMELFSHERMCPHLHLCVQSGSERVLLAMRRQYTAAGYRETVEKLRSRYPRFNLTTDVIVGFPGETEEDFRSTVELVRWARFSHVHTFPYSVRTGTRAARMSGHVSNAVKSARSEEIRAVAEAQKRDYRTSLIGSTERVLVEKSRSGYGEHYVPVVCATETLPANEFVDLRIDGIEEGEDPSLLGVLAGEREPSAVRRRATID